MGAKGWICLTNQQISFLVLLKQLRNNNDNVDYNKFN
jgi:hypothetical protein